MACRGPDGVQVRMVSQVMLSALVMAAPVGTAAAKPQAVTLTTLSAPFGHFGDVVQKETGSELTTDLPVRLKWASCEPQVVRLAAQVAGSIRAIEQLTQWLKDNKLEGTFFARKELLTESIALLSKSTLSADHACAPLKLGNGYALPMADAPKKLCAAPVDRSTGDYWLTADGKTAAVMQVSEGAPVVCKPRVSTLLFDSKGKARLRINLDWGGTTSFTLFGDRCQNLEFTFDAGQQAFVPKKTACK